MLSNVISRQINEPLRWAGSPTCSKWRLLVSFFLFALKRRSFQTPGGLQMKYKLFNYLVLTLATSCVNFTVLNNKAIASNQISQNPPKTLLTRRIICSPRCREVSRSDSFYIISPVAALLDSNLPKFSWSSIEDTTSYIVRLSSSEGT